MRVTSGVSAQQIPGFYARVGPASKTQTQDIGRPLYSGMQGQSYPHPQQKDPPPLAPNFWANISIIID